MHAAEEYLSADQTPTEVETFTPTPTEVVGDGKTIDVHGEILLRCGKSEIHTAPDGVITIKGFKLIVEEEALTKITSAKIELN